MEAAKQNPMSKPRNNNREAETNAGIQTKMRGLSQMPGTRIKTARLSHAGKHRPTEFDDSSEEEKPL